MSGKTALQTTYVDLVLRTCLGFESGSHEQGTWFPSRVGPGRPEAGKTALPLNFVL